MALTTQAWGHDGKTYDGKDMRQLVESIFPTPDSGVITGLATSQQGSPAATVQVSAGKAIIAATGSGLTGAYHVWNDAALTSPSITATTTNGRKDRLILRVTSGVPALEVVQGTASGSPAEPAITGDNYIELALITLPGSTTNITDAMLTDRRVFATAAGGQILATSSTRPSETRKGMAVFETDTGLLVRRNAADAAWLAWGNVIVCTSSTRPTGQEGMLIVETDTDRMLVYDGSAWQRLRHYSSTGRTGGTWTRGSNLSYTTGVGQVVTFTAETSDSDGYLTPTSGTITIPAGLGGLYAYDLSFTWSGDPSAQRVQVKKNGSVWQSLSLATSDTTAGVGGTIRLAAADTLSFDIIQTSGTSRNLNPATLNLDRISI